MTNKKIFATIDLSKIDKNKVKVETYQKRDGTTATARRYQVEIIPLREPKAIGSGKMLKTHFIIQGQTKEERDAKTESVTLGDGLQFNDAVGQDDWGGM